MPKDTPRPRAGDHRRTLIMSMKVAFALAAATGMWTLVWSVVGSPYHWMHSMFAPAGIVLAFGLMILRTEQRWARPARELKALLKLVHEGQAPIDELGIVAGGMSPLALTMQDVLRDLKHQRLVLAQLQQEMRDRVANRTHALERQIGSLQQQASRDALTGLYNRRMLDSLLPALVTRCQDEASPLSVLMIDVDYFKPLNDTLGHAAGDRVLRDIAQIIRSGVRECDAAFRVGGDEFLVVMPSADSDAARSLAGRLSDTVDGLVKPLKLALPVRLSIGVASLSDVDPRDAPTLIREADARLYAVKGSRQRIASAIPKKLSA